jgi:hypothetical protein
MTMLRTCGYCHQSKLFVWNGKKMGDGSKLYTDDTGSRWSGRRCPECERKRVQAAVKFGAFEKNLLIQQIEAQGFKVTKFKDIVTAEKEGATYTFQARRGATTKDGQIILDCESEAETDFTIILFQSTRICTKDQMNKLNPTAQQFQHTPAPRHRKAYTKQEGHIFDAQDKI